MMKTRQSACAMPSIAEICGEAITWARNGAPSPAAGQATSRPGVKYAASAARHRVAEMCDINGRRRAANRRHDGWHYRAASLAWRAAAMRGMLIKRPSTSMLLIAVRLIAPEIFASCARCHHRAAVGAYRTQKWRDGFMRRPSPP